MENLETRKTRIDLAWRFVSVCLTILGAIIVYFGQKIITVPKPGDILFVGGAALCTMLFIVSIRYIYLDAQALHDDNGEIYQNNQVDITTAYKHIFQALKFGLIYIAIHVLSLSLWTSGYVEWLSFAEPKITHLWVTGTMSIIFTLIPYNHIWEFTSIKTPNTQDATQTNMPPKSIRIETNKLKIFQWTCYSACLFDIWYIVVNAVPNTLTN